MNRKNKFILIGIVIILYLIIVVNFHKIRFGLSLLHLYSQEKKADNLPDETVTTKPIVDNPLQNILDSIDNEDKLANSHNTQEESVDKPIDNVAHVEEQKKSRDIKDTKKTDVVLDNKESYISIVSIYNNKLLDLKSNFEDELDELIEQGIEEYSTGKVSNTKLANKYLSLGSDLEKSSDSRFNKVLKEMEKELKNNDHTTSIIKEIKDYYISFKNAKKTDLINRGMKYVE